MVKSDAEKTIDEIERALVKALGYDPGGSVIAKVLEVQEQLQGVKFLRGTYVAQNTTALAKCLLGVLDATTVSDARNHAVTAIQLMTAKQKMSDDAIAFVRKMLADE